MNVLTTSLPTAHLMFGGEGAAFWILIGLAGAVTAWTIWLAVRYALVPGETESDHIKRLILDDSYARGLPPPAPPAPPRHLG